MNWFFTVSTLRGCGDLERTDFLQYSFNEVVVVLKVSDFWQFLSWMGVVVLKELIFNSFYCWKGVVVLKELIFYNFYFGRVWWSWRNWFFTVSMMEECGGLERTHFYIYIIDSMDWFFTVSTLRGCGGLERTDFLEFLLCEVVVVLKKLILTVSSWMGVVVLKELIFNSFYFGRVWWSWRNWFFTVSMMEECGGLERTHFYIYIIDSMDWFFTVSTLRGCGGLERTDFLQFLLCEVVVVLKELILKEHFSMYCWKSVVVLKELIFFTISMMEECGGLERTDFLQFIFWGCGWKN